jgi:hypothetical protein
MLHQPISVPFPEPGSKARCVDLVWTVRQRNADGTFLLMGDHGNRRATLDEMSDPALDNLNVDGLDRTGIDQMKWLRDRLANTNQVEFQSLRSDLLAAAHRDECPTADGVTLSGLLRRLGWRHERKVATSGGLMSIWRRERPPVVPA